MGSKMKKIEEQKNLKKQGTTLTDQEIIKLDEEIRESKIGKRYEPDPAKDVVRCLNQLNDNLGLILVEMRRMCDILSYLTTRKEE
jgi:hypothetical protein